MDTGLTQIKAVWTLPSTYKITPGSSFFFFLLITAAWIVFLKKITKSYNLNNFCVKSNIFHHKYKDKCFSGVNKKRVFLLSKRVFLWNEPAKLNPLFCESPICWKFHTLLFCKFSETLSPLKKNIYFDVYNDSYCSMLLTACRVWWKLQWVFFFKFPRITKKRIIQRNIPLRTITPRSNPLSMHSQISQILDQTPSSFTFPHVIKGP